MSEHSESYFPPVRFRLKKVDDTTYVWDSLRKKWLVLTPEERVRRYAITLLVSYCNIPPTSIVQEYPVHLNGMMQRADIVAMDSSARPLILIECKAPDIAVDRVVLDQAARYNSVVKARYILLTNGSRHRCYEYTDGKYAPSGIPRF